jgi:hypothetical protein
VSDDFLSGLREQPRPEFERDLRDRLRAIEGSSPAAGLPPRPRRLVPAFAGVAAAAVLAFAFSLEPVRAAAREFLDLFRVQRFAAVRVDPERLASLQKSGLDLKSLVGGQVEVVTKAVEPVAVSSAETGAVDAGIEAARQPARLPEGFALAGASVVRPGEYRIRLDAAKLRSLAQIAGADEIEVPDHWTGATIDVAMPPVLVTRYERPAVGGEPRPPDADAYVLLQARGPEIELPEGVDLATLGRLALRVGGLGAGEALSFSQRIDWRSTLLVPVPVSGADYREVEVRGQRGLLVSSPAPSSPSPEGARRRAAWRSVLMWSEGGNVYALHGPGSGWQIVDMAQTLK